ncbi:MAG: DNA-binding protein [Candidatus Aquicultor secundus]|uniref:DNA-binding protein n=1 Tax=Candidatus Aquicultor secundus TaxID=1973895 RepID=A0A2M7T5Y1_9ACTN|nr:MAG: DNA-binding protein [Candidatus Aquicultor secundus]PIW22487.1 MAG: DNA-binding protein [Candidatus Aquicultor secundus]PIZ35965.1 MAG: DNA-binding protein [Candidatus Aquicultor secundus]
MNSVVNEKDAAKYIGMSVSFLRQARCDGPTANRTPGPVFLRLGRAIRYRTEDLDKWLEEHRCELVKG